MRKVLLMVALLCSSQAYAYDFINAGTELSGSPQTDFFGENFQTRITAGKDCYITADVVQKNDVFSIKLDEMFCEMNGESFSANVSTGNVSFTYDDKVKNWSKNKSSYHFVIQKTVVLNK